MIDIHAHILPGVDDGAPNLESAVQMVALAEECGVTAIVATPHSHLTGSQGNYWDVALRRVYGTLQAALKQTNSSVLIFPGMEIYGMPDVPALLRQGRLIPLARSRYPLIEFPFQGYEREATQVLSEVAAMGYRPVVAHPERYRYVQENPSLLNRWVKMGCLLQINKGSLMGRFGRAPEMLSMSLLDRGFASFVASDAHSPVVRTTWMTDVKQFLCSEYSERLAVRLLEENPRKLLADAEIHVGEPEWF